MVDSKRRNACGLVVMSSPGSRRARMSKPVPSAKECGDCLSDRSRSNRTALWSGLLCSAR
jgi:hypothetical protein